MYTRDREGQHANKGSYADSLRGLRHVLGDKSNDFLHSLRSMGDLAAEARVLMVDKAEEIFNDPDGDIEGLFKDFLPTYNRIAQSHAGQTEVGVQGVRLSLKGTVIQDNQVLKKNLQRAFVTHASKRAWCILQVAVERVKPGASCLAGCFVRAYFSLPGDDFINQTPEHLQLLVDRWRPFLHKVSTECSTLQLNSGCTHTQTQYHLPDILMYKKEANY